MKTKKFRLDSGNIDLEAVRKAADTIKNGGTVVFPTETVYGLGANALDGEAVKQIFAAKGRPGDNPLIVHIEDFAQLKTIAEEIPVKARKLMEVFWPGPITFILRKSENIPDEVSAGLDTVGVRMPSNMIARALIRESALPIAAPSANLSGKPSPTTSEAVIEDLDGRVDSIIVSEDSEVGIESTVIDMTKEPPVILRPGKINQKDIQQIIGEVQLSEGITTGLAPEKPASPGMKYQHYSPRAEVLLVNGSSEEILEKILNFIDRNPDKNYKIIRTRNPKEAYPSSLKTVSLGKNTQEYARNLYRELRDSDKEQADVVLVEQFPIDEESIYIADRLLHASGYKTI